MNVDPKTIHRVRIMNVKSQRYLSIEGDNSNWNNDDASLTIRDWLNLPVLQSPQVWNIVQTPQGHWLLLNQYTCKLVACIRGRSNDNGATVIQYHTQVIEEPFQQWDFVKKNDNYLIQNVNSEKYIGPHGRTTSNDEYCIQYVNQTAEDTYQLWTFEEI